MRPRPQRYNLLLPVYGSTRARDECSGRSRSCRSQSIHVHGTFVSRSLYRKIWKIVPLKTVIVYFAWIRFNYFPTPLCEYFREERQFNKNLYVQLGCRHGALKSLCRSSVFPRSQDSGGGDRIGRLAHIRTFSGVYTYLLAWLPFLWINSGEPGRDANAISAIIIEQLLLFQYSSSKEKRGNFRKLVSHCWEGFFPCHFCPSCNVILDAVFVDCFWIDFLC